MGLQKSGTTDNFAFYYQNKDHLGTVRETVTSTGAMKQRVNYYPFGGQLVDTLEVMMWNRDFQQYKYNGKEFDGMYDLNTYDYGARQHYPILARWDRIDPLCEKYYGISPYAYCADNPVNCVDLHGCDTIYINKVDNKWVFNDPIVSDGNDVFIINDGENSTTITYDEGEYGQRVCALNLDINEDYTLGVYYVSGSGEKGLGYYVTPGGAPSEKDGSGARIPEGNYPILAPNGGKWRQPQVGGNVVSRGIRFHYGYITPRDWTEGCFVLSSDYSVDNGKIQYTKQNSMDAVQNFDYELAGGELYKYSFTNSKGRTKTRYGSKFNNRIKHKLYLKTK